MSLIDRKSLELQSQLMVAARNLVTACYLKLRNSQATTLDLSELPATDQLVLNHLRLKNGWSSLIENGISRAAMYPLLNKAGIEEINDDLSVIVISCSVGVNGKCKVIAKPTTVEPDTGLTDITQPTEPTLLVATDPTPVPTKTTQLDFKTDLADLIADQTRSLSKHLNCPAYFSIVMNALIDAAAGDLKARLLTLRDRK